MWAQSAAELGKILATARRHRGLTQAALARSLGVTQKWLSEIERGKESAHLGKVLRVLSFLGVRLEVGEAPWLLPSRRVSPNFSPSPLADIVTAHSTSAGRRKTR